MSKLKTLWDEQPYVAPSIQSFFHIKPSGACKSLPLSVALLQEVLNCLPEIEAQSKHYTQPIRTELGQRRSLDKVGYVAVKVTEFVLLQKDIGLLLNAEINSDKPDAAFMGHLRDIVYKLSDIRQKAEYPYEVYKNKFPVYTNDL